MGDTGPCGPCSEVHFHQGDHIPCAEEAAGRQCLGPACECDRWLEIWNLVFMQFDRDASGKLTPLPKPSIDTGMGLERIAAVVQGKLVELRHRPPAAADRGRRAALRQGLRRPRGRRRVDAGHRRPRARDGVPDLRPGLALERVAGLRPPADHAPGDAARAASRARGAVPLAGDRRRRGADGRRLSGARGAAERVAELTRLEEERFAETLDRGLERIAEEAQGAPRAGRAAGRRARTAIPGKVLFTLYDTYGFPVDLAQEVLQERGFAVTPETQAEYEQEMEAQRERARASATFGGGGADGDRGRGRLPDAPGGHPQGRVPRLRGDDRAGPDPRDGRGRATPARGGGGRRGRGDPRPHAVLRRVGRPDRRHRRHHRPAGARRGRGHAVPRRGPDRAPAPRRGGGLPRGRGRRGLRRVPAPPGPPAPPHGHASPARGAPEGARDPRDPGRLARGPRPPPLRLHARQAGEGPGSRAGRGPGQRGGPGEHHGRSVLDRSGRGPEDGRDGALRGEVRQSRPGHPDRRLLHRALRRDAPGRDRADRALQGHDRGRGRLRGPPPRGGHRQRGARPRRPGRARAPPGGRSPPDPAARAAASPPEAPRRPEGPREAARRDGDAPREEPRPGPGGRRSRGGGDSRRGRATRWARRRRPPHGGRLREGTPQLGCDRPRRRHEQ